ncbi:MAG: dipeptidase [Desulfitobacteriaceae bacterium]|nr:dipeptidase [Desulfitobacteriaceae bacterium]
MESIWVADGHCDSLGDYLTAKRTLKYSSEGGHWDLQKAKEGNVALQFMAAFIESEYKPDRAVWRGFQLLDAANRFIKENTDAVFPVLNKDNLRKVANKPKIGIIIGVEGGEILGDNILMLDKIFQLGVRVLGLTWNQQNAIGYGIGASNQKEEGLTLFGRQVIKRLNELGMLIDVSHLNEPGFWDVLECSQFPIVASHSCAEAICPHPRNLTDQQLKSLAANGGVVGINFNPPFLTRNPVAKREDVVRHISYIAEVAGIETVGLGSDFDGISDVPEKLTDAAQFPGLAQDLLKAGFSTEDVRKIFNKNLIRLLSSVLK